MSTTTNEHWRAKQARRWAALEGQSEGWVDRHMIAFKCQIDPKTVHRKVLANIFPPYEHVAGPRLKFWSLATAKGIISGTCGRTKPQPQEHGDAD